ncbi:GMC family oxidoreductase [Dasania marina]|uniref:GMC family oxidoreductase n=1 Tax=Dasania marina TaxID=471499 RepID=UPI0030D950F4|tara:strand:+ start:61801 stop:63483 length:1683 start_codon:yes stop_codon:yes gene_type:complete
MANSHHSHQGAAAAATSATKFSTTEDVDFVIVGSGAAGGIMAKELSTAGFNVVVLEQGKRYGLGDFLPHDEWMNSVNQKMLGGSLADNPQTYRETEAEVAKELSYRPLMYGHMVGGGSVLYGANFWRFHEVDFKERSLLGPIKGSGFSDWPIDYQELEPYYTKVDWEMGVSGEVGPYDPPRSKGYPMPPLPIKSSGVLLKQAAEKLGLKPFAAPMAINSVAYNNRAPCMHCGFCSGHPCEMGAKSSSLATMLPLAEATGRCEIRSESTVFNIVTNAQGRVTQVQYWDKDGNEQAQRCKAMVLSANGAETPRLLLMSGVANSSGLVGKYLMVNAEALNWGVFKEPLNEYKSVLTTQVIHDFYDADLSKGYYGGGGIDARALPNTPIGFALEGLSPEAPKWGAGYKKMVAHNYTRTLTLFSHLTSLAMERNSISLDPTVKDQWGRPAIRMTYQDHPDDLKNMAFFSNKAKELLTAAGTVSQWATPIEPSRFAAHLMGTCRMGDDPATSVVDRYHRSHDVENLFICDGSSFVTSGRGQPTMTIMALAFRAAEHIVRFAKNDQI